MTINTEKYRIGKWSMTIIKESPIPERKNLVWDSTSDGDDIPLVENMHVKDSPLWWTIIIDDISKEQLDEMYRWCENNIKYMCGIRHDAFDNTVVGYFRHPDDALAFKWRWI